MLKNKLVLLGIVLAVGLTTAGVSKVVSTKAQLPTSEAQTFTPKLAQVESPPATQVTKRKVINLQPTPEQTIIFNTPFQQSTVELAIDRLEVMVSQGYSEAYLILDSPGGSVVDGAKLIAYMRNGPIKVNTVCDGLCASMAAHTFTAGAKRYMTDKSVLMFHPASGGARGTIEQMLNQLSMFKLYVDRLDAFAAARAGVDYNEFKNSLSQELWMETEDALTRNFADGLVFVSYPRNGANVFNMQNIVKSKNIQLTKTGRASVNLQ